MQGNSIFSSPPNSSEVVDISSADYTFTLKSIVAIYVGGAGTVIAKLRGDATARTWLGLAAGTYLHGNFEKVVKTSTTATGLIGVTGMRDAGSGA